MESMGLFSLAVISGQRFVGWVGGSEPHQFLSELRLVGLASLDPPYHLRAMIHWVISLCRTAPSSRNIG